MAAHFGNREGKVGSASYTWFIGLLRQNASELGTVSPFLDLYALPYALQPLVSLSNFFGEMITIFSDKECDATARKALAACKQGNSSITDYNSRFLLVVYAVSLMEESRILQYKEGLRADMAFCCCLQPGWHTAVTLAGKILLASEAVKSYDRLSASLFFRMMNYRQYQPTLVNPGQCRSPSHLQAGPSVAVPVNCGPAPMDIDVAALDPDDPMTVIRCICLERRLCFYCLKEYDASHRNTVTRKCPNGKASPADRIALMKTAVEPKTQNLAVVEEVDMWADINPSQQLEVQALVQRYWESAHPLSSSSVVYPETPADGIGLVVELSSVCVSGGADSARFLVNLRFPALGVTVPALVDMGAQGCFLNSSFSAAHPFILTDKEIPVDCVAFDGSPGVGGLVTREWVGEACLGDSNECFPLTLSVTNIGHHQVILGLPWLDSVGARLQCGTKNRVLEIGGILVACSDLAPASDVVLCTSPSPLTSPATPVLYSPPDPIFVLALSTTSTPTIPAKSSHPSLPPEFSAYTSVFLPQDIALPPHRPFDCAIHLMPGAVAPFGGLYTLTPDERSELRHYLDEQLAKGHIVSSSSAAAAPIFFVKVPGKKNRPVVDYRALKKVTVRDSYPIPVVGWLLNQLIGCKFFTKIDLKSAFNLLCVAKGDEWLTAFRTPWGLFEYQVMPFGLANAPAIFQRFIQAVLREYLDVFCFVYLDDILIFSKNRPDHVTHVSAVLEKLQEHKLTVSPHRAR